MKKIVILLTIILLLCGCEQKKCIKSHTEKDMCLRHIPIYRGKSVIMIPQYYECEKTVCDEYEMEEN